MASELLQFCLLFLYLSNNLQYENTCTWLLFVHFLRQWQTELTQISRKVCKSIEFHMFYIAKRLFWKVRLVHFVLGVWVKFNGRHKKLLSCAKPQIYNYKIITWSHKHLCSWSKDVQTSEQKNILWKNILFLNERDCYKLTGIKNIFVTKNSFVENSVFLM